MWKPIESAPTDRRILLWHSKVFKVAHIGWWNFVDKQFELVEAFKDRKDLYCHPTHWAEIPSYPD